MRSRPQPHVCLEREHHRIASVVAELKQDIARYWSRAGIQAEQALTPWRCASALLDPAVACLLLHRLAHCAYTNHVPVLPGLLAVCNRLLFKTSISPVSCVAGGWSIRHPAGLHFHAVAGRELTLFAYTSCIGDDVPVSNDLTRAPVIGARVRLGADAAIIGPVVVGDDVDIGIHAIVCIDVASGSKVLTNASLVRTRERRTDEA